MYFNIKCIGKLPGLTNEFERYLVFETGEFERPKFDCNYPACKDFDSAELLILSGTLSVSNSLDPDQDQHSASPGLGPKLFAKVISR